MAPAADGAQDGAQTQYAPNPRIQYAEPAYWDQRYKAQPLSFDWFYGWQALRKLIRTHLPRRKAVIQIGCGNSNLQEGMARNGYHVVNVDISQVVIDQMREQHASIPNCTYVLGDCRDLSMFGNCHFYGAIEKGTIDALVCSPDSAVNIHRMCMELLRVLQPGATFMAISLGEPSQRLPLLCRPEYGWTVSLCLIPRVGADAMVPAPGRPIPLNDTVKPIHHLGPFRVAKDLSIEGLPTTYEPAGYFYAYLCRKAPLMLRTDSKGKGTLPQMRTSIVRETMEQLQQQLGLSKDVLTRGRRKNLVNKKEFLASQPADQQPISRQGSTHSSSRGREPAGAAAAAAGPHAPPITAGVAADATPFRRHSRCGAGSLTLTHPPQPSSLTQQPGSSRSSSSSLCPHGRPQDQHSPSEGEAQFGGAKQVCPGMMGGYDGSSVLPKLADLEAAAAAGGVAGAAAREAAAAAAAAPPVSAESPFLLHSTSRLAKLPQPSSNQLAEQQQQPGPHQAQPAAPLSLQCGDADDRSVAGQAQRSLPPAYSYLAGSRASSTCASLASEDGEGDLEGQGGEADPTYSRPSLDLVRLHDLQCVDPVSTRAVEGGQPALQSTLPQLQQQQQEQQQGQQGQGQQQLEQGQQGQQEQQHQQLRLQG